MAAAADAWAVEVGRASRAARRSACRGRGDVQPDPLHQIRAVPDAIRGSTTAGLLALRVDCALGRLDMSLSLKTALYWAL